MRIAGGNYDDMMPNKPRWNAPIGEAVLPQGQDPYIAGTPFRLGGLIRG